MTNALNSQRLLYEPFLRFNTAGGPGVHASSPFNTLTPARRNVLLGDRLPGGGLW